MTFEIVFTCNKIAVVEVFYTALAPSFKNVTFSFIKNCSHVKG